MLRFQETEPSQALRPFVHALWQFEAAADAPPVHHVPPDGCVSIVLAPAGPRTRAVIVGPRMTDLAVPVTPLTRYCGVRMRPEAAGLLLSITPAAWTGLVAPLEDADPHLAGAIAAGAMSASYGHLLEVLEARASGSEGPDVLVHDALAVIDGGDFRVESIARSLGVSKRTLQRRFVAASGLSPKSFVRIRRFRHAVAHLLQPEPQAWGRIAVENGFADQSHLVREVTALAGAPPSAVEARVRRIAHVNVRP